MGGKKKLKTDDLTGNPEYGDVLITSDMVERWKRDRHYGKTTFEIAREYGVTPGVVSSFTHRSKEKLDNYIDNDRIKPISEEEFRKRDLVPNRNVRGLSGKAMARLLMIDAEEG